MTIQITDTNTITALEDSHYLVAQKSATAVDKILYSSVSAQMVLRGGLVGGIEFNTSALPPTIKAGTYNIKNRNWIFESDYNLALADVLGNCSQTLSDYSYQYVFAIIRSSDGAKMWCPAYDIASPIGTYALDNTRVFSAVNVTSGTAVFTTANTSGLVVADGHNVVAMLSDGKLISGQLTAVVASTSFSLKTSLADGAYVGGTYDAYYRIYTQHGTGPTGIIVDADVTKYTPSPPHCPALNIYGVDQYGRPTATAADVYARILGPQYIGAAGAAGSVVSYKDGDDKNDNEFDLTVASNNKGSTNTNVIELDGSHYKIWGSDYIFVKSAINGDSLQPQKSMWLDGSMSIQLSAANIAAYCKAGSSITNAIVGGQEDIGNGLSQAAGHSTFAINGKIIKSNYVWISTPGTLIDFTITRWRGKFTK